jgi:hypothetical protein
MKIGILTYQRAHNYGALLQAYALRTYLKKFSFDVEYIDYWPKYHSDAYRIFSVENLRNHSFLGQIKFILLFILSLPRVLNRKKGFNNFIRYKLELERAPRYLVSKDILEDFDIVIYGSDQIWRYQNLPLFKGFDYSYFGEYPINVKKKIAYAASMGEINIIDSEQSLIIKNISQFNSISVRENNLKSYLENIGIKSTLVLDPVFLLSKIEWLSLECKKAHNKKNRYILFYHLMYSREAIEFVNKLSESTGLKVIEIQGEVKPLLIGNRFLQTLPPEEFITLVNNAEYVVSTSFHGVAFSLIFQKQFYALGMKGNLDRVLSLLNLLNLSNRYITDNVSFSLKERIDYTVVEPMLIKYISKSQSFLNKAIRF